MPIIRQSFYMIIGLTFPFFWAYHAAGFLGFLYKPILLLTGATSTGFPSYLTSSCIYIFFIVCFEVLYRKVFQTGRPADNSALNDFEIEQIIKSIKNSNEKD